MFVTQRQTGYITQQGTLQKKTGCSTLDLVCALNDAKTGLADMKGNIVKKE